MNKKRLIIPLERARIMLDIMNVLVEFHNIKFVHGDIKPENILSYLPENQHKLAGFRYTKREDEQFSKRAGGYLAPERRVKDSKLAGLTYKEDIFSLAMTLLKIEGLDISVDDLIPDTCFENEKSPSKCQENVNKKVEEVFSEKNKLYPKEKSLGCLLPVFLKALSFDLEIRYKSMEEFEIDILDKLTKLDGVFIFFRDILIKEIKALDEFKKPSIWICRLLTMEFMLTSKIKFPKETTFEISTLACNKENKIVATPIVDTTKIVETKLEI